MKKLIYIISVVVSLTFTTSAWTSELTLMTEDWPPLNFISKGILTGPAVDIVKAIQKNLNEQSDIQVMPWKRAFNYAENKNHHVLFSMVRTEKRDKRFKWVGPISVKRYSFFALEENQQQLNKLMDFKPYKIGVQQGGYSEDLLIDYGFKQLEPVIDQVKNFHKLKLGRIDFVYDSETTLEILKIKHPDIAADIVPVHSIRQDYLYIAFNKATSDETIAQWQSALYQLDQKGVIAKIYQNYGMESLYFPINNRTSMNLYSK